MFVVGVFSASNVGRRPWQPGKRVWSVALFGAVNMDFHQAQLEEASTRITCFNLFAATRLRVPENIPVNMSGLSLFGATTVKSRGDEESSMSSEHALNITRFNIFGATAVTS